MALTKISTGMLKQDAASSDLNIDAGTLYLDVSNNRVGIANTSPSQALDVTGNVVISGTATATTFVGSGASLTSIPNSALTNSSITINSTATSLGGSITLGTDDVAEGSTNLYYTDARADARVALVVDSAPSTLNTLNELAAALGDDANFSTTVTNSIAAKLPLAGGTLTGNLSLGDNVKAIFGAGSDLEIYHDGSNSFIADVGTGNLGIRAENLFLQNADGSENYATATLNGAFTLSYDNSQKLATTSTGIDVTGSVTAYSLEIGTLGASNANAFIDLTGDTTYTDFGFRIIRNSGANGRTDLRHRGTGDFVIEAVDAAGIAFETTDTERMRIDSSGNVLIGSIGTGSGTATPVELNLGSTFANSVGSLAKAKLKVFEDSSANIYGLSVSSGLLEYGVPSSAAHAFFVNESEKMRIDSSGNVGIGQAPDSGWGSNWKTLQVTSLSAHFASTSSNTYSGLTHGGYYDGTQWRYNATDVGATLIQSVGSTSPSMHFYVANSGTADSVITWTEAMRIDSSGKIQIGNNIPMWSGYWGGALFLKGNNSTPDRYAQLAIVNNLGNIVHQGLILDNDGNVGIGTTSPLAKLQVTGSEVGVYGGNTTTGPGIFLGDNNFVNSNYYNSAPGIGSVGPYGGVTAGLAFYVYGSQQNSRNEAMRIDDAGNVGIGTTSPQSKLEANLHSGADSALMNTNSVNDVQLLRAGFGQNAGTTSNAGAKWGLRFVGRNDATYDNGKSGAIYAVSEDSAGYNRKVGLAFHTSAFDAAHTERMRIDSVGNVGIGVTSIPGWAQLMTSGTVAVGGILYIKQDQKIQALTGFPGGAGSLILNPDGGTVGIGTSSPVTDARGSGGSTRVLIKYAAGQEYLELQAASTTSNSSLLFSDGSSGDYGVVQYSHATNEMDLYAKSNPKLRIEEDGIDILRGQKFVGTYTYTASWATSKQTIVPNGTLPGGRTYLVLLVTDSLGTSPYYAETAFLFRTTASTNGNGINGTNPMLTSHHVGSTSYWDISTTTTINSTNGLAAQLVNGPQSGGSVGSAIVRVYVTQIQGS